jgi:peroxiredoxin
MFFDSAGESNWWHMSLKAQLDACRRAFEASTPPGIVAALEGSVAELVQTGLVRQALKAGERAPLFRLQSDTGDFVVLSEALDSGPVVVSFFWGGWCPFCRLELQALGQAHSEIERLGATLIALSPQARGKSSSLGRGCEPPFPILRDPGCKIASRYRIAFTIPHQFRAAYLELGYPNSTKKKSWLLSIPATYVLDSSGFVVLSYIDADHTTRLEPTEIIAALTHLRAANIPDRNNR